MKKIVALCSGGFDSVLMVHSLRDLNEDAEIHTLFFDYGQRSVDLEREKAIQVSEKLSCVFHEVAIPSIPWTRSNFYGEGFHDKMSQYLEYRNLIFFSYALSLAQSIGAEKVCAAILDAGEYTDTSKQFIQDMNEMAINSSGISIETPFSEYEKEDLFYTAKILGVMPGEYHSCDVPVNGHPCGECPDCLALKEYEDYISVNTPIKAFLQTMTSNEDFCKLVKETKLQEVRALINNQCQLHCSHCFYGFEDMTSRQLTKEEMLKALCEGVELGAENIHFSGKEPLFDDTIFWYTEKLHEKYPELTFDVVTNGITIPQYAQRLKDNGFTRVCISIDEVLNTNGVRSVHGVADKALKALKEVGLKVEVFIDLHENNFDKVESIVRYLHEQYGVNNFYVRTLALVGNARDMVPLTTEELNTTFLQLQEVSKDLYDEDDLFSLNLTVGAPYVYKALTTDCEMAEAIDSVFDSYDEVVSEGFSVHPEAYCSRYEGQITITPDGYVLGCGTEMSDPNYAKNAAGNVLNEDLKTIYERGKSICSQVNCKCCASGKPVYKNCTHF